MKKQFWIVFVMIMLGFSIPFATYYPAIMAYDVIPQLTQIMSGEYTTHHPLVHTLMLAMCLQLGKMIPCIQNTDTMGLAIYSFLQMAVVAAGFSYTYIFMRKHKVHKVICVLFVLAVAFYPTCGMLAVSITKDTIYATFVLVFSVCLCEILLSKGSCLDSNNWNIGYGIVTVLLLLFRNNSIYAWVVFFVASIVCFWCKAYQKKILGIHLTALAGYFIVNGTMIALCGATSDTYAREMLSVPAQQIARVVAYHEGELDAVDRQLLESVWGEDNLPEYVPAIADRSKRDISNDVESLEAFWDLWLRLLQRYPGDYIEAFLLKNKGIWDIQDTSYLNDIYTYAKGYLQITYPSDQQEYMENLLPGYHRHQHLQILQSVYRYFAGGDEVWRYVPVLNIMMQPALYCWALLYYIIVCQAYRKKELILPAVYLVVLLGTIAMGPCILVRYVYPVMLTVPMLYLVLLQEIRQ